MTWALPRLLSRASGVLRNWRRGSAALTPEAVRDLSQRLQQEKQALEAFTASLEQEFLQLGSLLRKITTLTGDVRSRSSEIVDAAAGRTEDAAIQFAFQLLKKAEDVVLASREQHNSVFEVFEKIHVDLTRVAREGSALTRTLFPLETTNTQFRIQACSFDQNTRTQFFTLADAIAAIVRDVQSAVGQRFEDLNRTARTTGELADKLSALATKQRIETERMLAETRTHLSTLDEALRSSERTAQSISDAGANIAGGVATAIVALQCQDMARQKLQHIGAAIDEMVRHLPASRSTAFTSIEEADCRHFLADAGRVQLGQLRSVFEQLGQAAIQVNAGLADVESVSKLLTGGAVQSGRAALDGQIIQSAIESIHAVLLVIGNAVSSITEVVALVVRLKSTFSDCTTQILALALRLREVALNAQIFAANVDVGASLEVVARNTRLIADESMDQLQRISSRVNELLDTVTNLEHRLADYSEVAAVEQTLLTSEATESEKKLRSLDQALRASMAAIGPVEMELTGTIERLIRSIHFPAAVAEAEGRSTALFEHIAGLYSERASAAHHKLRNLVRNYTMAHEREVHATAVKVSAPMSAAVPAAMFEDPSRGGKVPAPPALLSAPDAGEEKLADNVELF